MKKYTLASIVVVAVLVAIAAGVYASTQSSEQNNVGNSQNSQNQAESQPSQNQQDSEAVMADSVEISDFKYSPETITVKVSTTVTWTNNDEARHNVVSDDDGELDGPLIAKGETWSYTFDKAGEYPYHCAPHPYMKGKVIVTE